MAMLGKPVAADTKVRPFSEELMEYLHIIYKEGHITFVFSTGLVVHAKTAILRSHMQLCLMIIDYTNNTSGKYIKLKMNSTSKRKSEHKSVNGVSIKFTQIIQTTIHIAVCWTFHGPSNKIANETVDHINRIKSDNRSDNLRWAGFQLQKQRRIFVVLKIVPILALVMAENAKIMEDFTKLKQHYVKCPRAVNMLKVIVGSVLLMEEGKNASMPVAQKMLKNGVTVKIMEDGKNASMLVAQKVLEVWGSVMLMEEGQNASMPVAQKVLKKGVTVLNME
jgi:hypothetical protein